MNYELFDLNTGSSLAKKQEDVNQYRHFLYNGGSYSQEHKHRLNFNTIYP